MTTLDLKQGEPQTGWLAFEIQQPNRFIRLQYGRPPDFILELPCCKESPSP